MESETKQSSPIVGEDQLNKFFDESEGITPSLSPSVEGLVKELSDAKPVNASTLTQNLLNTHSRYIAGKAGSITLVDTPIEHTTNEWLAEIKSLFDFKKMQNVTESKQIELHGRLLIIGLCLLDPQLRTQLEKGGHFKALLEEIHEKPVERFLTPRGLLLMAGADSVPTQPDDPLKKLENDQLGRAAFARYLAKRISAIDKDAGSYSIHIFGPWGSGKSTMLNFLKEILEHKNKWKVVEFNAWRNQHIRPPWWSLLESVFQQTKQNLNAFYRLAEYWWRFNTGRIHYLIGLAVLAWLIALFGLPFINQDSVNGTTLSKWALASEQLSKIIAFIVTIWGIVIAFSRSLLLGSAKAAKTYMELTHDPMNRIKKRFTKLIKRLQYIRIAVFIDDLDRCQSDYVVELLEGIQTVFREAPVVFVVAADRRWLNACYEEAYKNLKEMVKQPGKPLGMLFLEKAFQFYTSVPGIPEKLRDAYWLNLIKVKDEESAASMEKEREAAKQTMADKSNEGDIIHEIDQSKSLSFNQQRALREEAVIRLASPEVVERTEHALKPFANLLEPNPRSMKRLVNAYSVNRAIATLAYIDVERHHLALWTILSLRWPLLAEYLIKNPDLIEKIGADDLTDIDEDLQTLFNDRDVLVVVNKDADDFSIDSNIVRKCALLRG